MTDDYRCDILNKVLKPQALKYMPKTVGPALQGKEKTPTEERVLLVRLFAFRHLGGFSYIRNSFRQGRDSHNIL